VVNKVSNLRHEGKKNAVQGWTAFYRGGNEALIYFIAQLLLFVKKKIKVT